MKKIIKTIDWNNISDSRKIKINKQKPILINLFRNISEKRLLQIINKNKDNNICIAVLKNSYIEGFEKSPQFKTYKIEKLEKNLLKIIKKYSKLKNKIQILKLYQRDWEYVLKELNFSKIILINGTWKRAIHFRKEYWILEKKYPNSKINFISPFINETEATKYGLKIQNSQEYNNLINFKKEKKYSDKELMQISLSASKQSFAWDFQTGALLAKKNKVILYAHNQVMPYETYAMHYGSIKEKNFSPPNDLNFYDTIHAEVILMLKAIEKKIDLKDTSLYINLMPCPTCAKMIAKSQISKIIYKLDHSDSYAFDLFKKTNKCIKRL